MNILTQFGSHRMIGLQFSIQTLFCDTIYRQESQKAFGGYFKSIFDTIFLLRK